MIIEPNNCYNVYIHITPSNKIYVGITKNIKNRFRSSGDGYRNCKLFYNAIKKYGWDNIRHEVLFENLTKEQAEQKEIELIELYHSNNQIYGYNILKGGNISTNDSIERREKISKSLKEYNATHILEKEERAKKVSFAKKGVPLTEEHKKKLKENHKGFLGKTMSKEHKEKISKANSGRKFSKLHLQKISNAHKGKIISKETRAKISIALKGKKGNNKTPKKVAQLYDNGELYRIYKNAKEASAMTNIALSTIYRYCNSAEDKKTHKGYMWQYVR